MKTVTIWTKAGLKFHYELRGEEDKVEIYADILHVRGWIHEYTEIETDSGKIRTTNRQEKVEAFIPWANLEYYEIAEKTA
jgi:hypothetical protein